LNWYGSAVKSASEEEIDLWKSVASTLKGTQRRQFMAQVVNIMGRGGPSFAEEVLGWNRGTIRKGQLEVRSGQAIEDRFHERGRRRAEEHLPDLLQDISSIMAAAQSESSLPIPGSHRLLSAKEIHRRLISEFDYTDAELPCAQIGRAHV